MVLRYFGRGKTGGGGLQLFGWVNCLQDFLIDTHEVPEMY